MDAKFDVDNWFSNFIEKLELPAEDKIKLLKEYRSLKDNDGANSSKEELDSFLKESIGGYRGMLYGPKELARIAKWSDRKLKDNEGDQHNISNAVTDKLFTNLSPMLVGPISIPEPSVEDEIQSELEKFIQQKPYNIVVLGQRGVGKRTAVKALFGLSGCSKGFAVEEKNVVMNSLRPKEGIDILIYDNKYTDNDEYFLDAALPDCDLILYIIDVSSQDMHKDFRLLKEHILPICERNNQLRNLILAFNKIDIMGECITPNDQELRWDVFNNEPTEKLKSVIKCRLIEIFEQLIAEKLVAVEEHTINPEQVMYFSAEYEYNLLSFIHYVIRLEHKRLTPLMWFLSKQKRVYMDEKEKSEYQKLTEENRDLYDSIKKIHPEWSHRQIFINVSCGYRGLIADTPTKESLWDKIKKMLK